MPTRGCSRKHEFNKAHCAVENGASHAKLGQAGFSRTLGHGCSSPAAPPRSRHAERRSARAARGAGEAGHGLRHEHAPQRGHVGRHADGRWPAARPTAAAGARDRGRAAADGRVHADQPCQPGRPGDQPAGRLAHEYGLAHGLLQMRGCASPPLAPASPRTVFRFPHPQPPTPLPHPHPALSQRARACSAI